MRLSNRKVRVPLTVWVISALFYLCASSVSALPVLFNLLNSAVVGVDWIASNTSRVVINSLGELNLRNGYVEVESQVFDFSEADSVDINFDNDGIEPEVQFQMFRGRDETSVFEYLA